MKPEKNPKNNLAANANSGQVKAGGSPTSQNISNELFSSRLIQQSPLSEEVFTNNTSSRSTSNNQQAAKPHSTWQRTRWMRMVFYTGVAILIFLLLFGGWYFFTNRSGNKSTGQFAVTSADLAGLNTNKITTPSGLVIVNGNTEISGSITANTFNGSGADLTNLNANNITSGTLNDARLSPNVALLNTTQTFTGNKTFTGSVSLPAGVLFNNLLYSFPASQQGGFLTNDGNGNLTWTSFSGCLTCLNNGGDSFGSAVSAGTNDPFSMSLRTNGANRLTISPTGSAVFSSTVTATQFFGNGAGLTNLDASNITAGTLSNARLSGSVTTQGNTFNGPDELVQLNAFGYLPAVNGGNLTSLNASNVTSGTLADARLTANVALLDGNQTFIGTNSFTQPITVNTLTPTAAMIIGATGQNLTLRGNSSTSWTSTSGGFTTTVGFTGVPTGAVTYQFDAAAAPGTYTICTTAGGACGGGGSGNVSTPGGTANTIPKFTAANTIGNSNITDNGTTITLGGTTTIISGTELRVNGAAGGFAIDATGDINAGTHLRVGGNIVCDSTGCNASGGGGFYIQNSTSQQSAANFFIQSASTILPTGTIKALGGQSSDLLQFQNSGGSAIADVYVGGGFNTTDKYYVNGVQISSSNLSDGTNLAKLNANQTFTGNNAFSGTLIQQNSVDSIHEFQVINSGGTTLFNIDSTTNKVAIGASSASWPLDVTGDINSSTGLRINGVLVCDSSGCTSTSSGGINNGTTTQVNANYNIQSSDVNAVVGVLKGKAAQVADLFQAQTSAGTAVFKVGQAGLTTINNGITLTGGNQTIQNNTGALNLTASSTTISLNNTTTITSGDGTGLQYAAHYAYQPFSLVDRNYVDTAIAGVIVGACPTCFLNGGNTFGTAASLGTNDNYTLTLKTANTPRITLGTNGGVALQGSTASGNYSTSAGVGVASGDYSFAIGGGTASGVESFAGGYNVNPITASGRGSIAFGASDGGAITAAGVGSVAIGNNVLANTVSGNWATAIGVGARANGTGSMAVNAGVTSGDYSFAANAGSTASGLQSFAINNGTASGINTFAGGYNAGGGAITAAGNGSMAFGYTANGAITANGVGSFAGGNQSSTGVNGIYSIAFGYLTQANGNYSAAFNNATASGTGTTAIGSSLVNSSGVYSFAGGYAQSAITSSSNGSFAFGRSGGFAITAAGEGSVALGYTSTGANIANGNGSLVGGSNSSTGIGAVHSIAFGDGSQANGAYSAAFNNSVASGTGAFSVGGGTASGQKAFAGGYNQTAITASGLGSFAFGRAGAFTITSSGEGSTAIGLSRDGAILASGHGSLAGGTNSTASNEFAIAYGTGTQATGAYSAAFNNSVASGTGAFSVGVGTASGYASFAGGSNGSQAYAQDSFAFGYNAKANNTIGIASTAFGRDTTANGNYTFAAGYRAASSGEGSVALNSSSASGTGSTSMGSDLVSSSGSYAFAGGYAQSVISATNNGSLAFGRAAGYTISSTGEGATALGASRDGAILASGYGALAGGSASTASGEFAIAYGDGTQATAPYSAAFNNARATNTGAFATGSGTASGGGSFAGGYINSFAVPLTASGLGSFAYGRAPGFTLTASGEGSIALGYSRDGAILASGNGSLAGGTNSSTGVGAEFAIAFGTGTQANGAYSAAFNNSIASNTGAFAINNATASGLFSFAGGENGSLAAGRDSLAFGYTTKANNVSGQMSVALGRETLANGSYSFAMGYGAVASNDGAFAIGSGQTSGYFGFSGYNSTASNTGAFAFGNLNTASGTFSTAFGQNNTASGSNSTAFGQNISVGGSYSFGINLNGAVPITFTDANSMAIMNGYIGVNTVSPSSFSSIMAVNGSGQTYGTTFYNTATAIRARAGDNVSGTLITFERADGTNVGSITHNGTNTAYNTASDARLKHDVVDTTYSLGTVLQLKVHDYKYNADTTDTTYTGFIAQELQQLFPEAVSVMDTKTGYLGVDYGKLTPLLAKGIQDLNTKVDNLQTEVDQLKNAQTASSTTSVDVVAELAKASAITINGNLTVNGKVIVAGNLELQGDNSGTVKIPAGQTRVHLSFTKAFTNVPNVTATPKSLTKASFAVENESVSGFDIVIDQAQTVDTDFNYHAL